MKKAFYADFIYYASKIHKDSWLITSDDGVIEGVTKMLENTSEYEISEFKNSAIFPGLINTHCHLGMGLFRGMADDLPLMTWLKKYIWPVEKKVLNAEFVYISTMISIAESIRSGVTCLNEMYFFPDSTARAFREASVRGLLGFGVFGDMEKSFKAADNFKSCELVKAALAPHALYTVGPDNIKTCVEFARSINIPIHTHLAETLDETKEIKEKYGKTPTELMDETGAFDHKSVFAHCVHLTESDIELLGRKKVNVSHCLESNLKLASGFAPIKQLMEKGANVSIGTDGASSNNDQSMIGEMATVSKFHKALNMDATALPAHTVLDMATKNAAACLGFDNIGALKKGYLADFFVLSFDAARMTPVYDPISHLVYAAENNDVTDVYVKGSPIMTDRKIVTFDEEFIKTEARRIARDTMGL